MVELDFFWPLWEDLLSAVFQAEHGPDSQVVLVAVGDEVDTVAIELEVEKQCAALPRGSIAAKALAHSYVLIVADKAEVCLSPSTFSPSLELIDAKTAVPHFTNDRTLASHVVVELHTML